MVLGVKKEVFDGAEGGRLWVKKDIKGCGTR